MSKLIPFLYVDQALEAIDFYKEVFDAKQVGEMTMLENIPGMERFKNKVGHCTLQIDGDSFFVADTLGDYPLKKGQSIQLVIDLGTEERLRSAFTKLSQEGQIKQELHEVFWGALFGSVEDKFGVTWQIYYGHK
jgi:PhnB protein